MNCFPSGLALYGISRALHGIGRPPFVCTQTIGAPQELHLAIGIILLVKQLVSSVTHLVFFGAPLVAQCIKEAI